MLVTLSGISMLVKPLQPLNASLPMLVTLPSSGITLFLQPKIKVLLALSMRQLPFTSYTLFPSPMVMLAKLVPLNAEPSILVRLSGNLILVKL